MLVVRYQYKTFVNIDIIDLNVLLSDLNCEKVAVYFSNRFITHLSLAQLNIPGKQATIGNKTGFK